MTERIIYLDIAALIILVISLISQLTRRMTKGAANQFFLLLVSISLLSCGLEIWADILDNLEIADFMLRRFAHSVQMIVYNMTTPCFLMYVISLTSVWHKIRRHKPLWVVLALPFATDISLMIYNIFTGIVVDYPDGVYTIMPAAFATYAAAGFYIIIALCYVIFYRKLFSLPKIICLMCQIPLAGIAGIIIPLFPDICVTAFTGAVGILLIAVLIQRPEENVDSFTGLRNYSAYAEDMKKYFVTETPVSLVMVNISNFETIQNIVDYDQTNDLLKNVGRMITNANKASKAHGQVYYLDRGRFRIAINSFYRDSMKKTAELINAELKNNIKINQFDLNLVAYVCTARCPEDIRDFKSLMAYGAEFSTKLPYNGEVMHADSDNIRKVMSLLTGIDSIIDNAFANHGFHVYYQPIYSIEEKRFVSAEALLRLIDEKEGFVSSEIFIPAAEKSGAIHKIGEFVLEEVCKFIGSEEFHKLGISYIEVNLSVSQCMQHGLSEKILGIMKKYGVSPEQINLEITETAASYDQSVMSENLNDLSKAGIAFSLDDYGTGYSNMYRIAALPLKIVKLDKSFVNSQSSKMWTILQNTVKMIKDLNMEIVVEGIETKDMVRKFSELHCDFIQGYYYSKPIPQDEFVKFVTERNSAAASV